MNLKCTLEHTHSSSECLFSSDGAVWGTVEPLELLEGGAVVEDLSHERQALEGYTLSPSFSMLLVYHDVNSLCCRLSTPAVEFFCSVFPIVVGREPAKIMSPDECFLSCMPELRARVSEVTNALALTGFSSVFVASEK